MHTLAARLAALAERAIRELEQSARVDLEKLAEALELLKMAPLAARPRPRRRGAAATDDLPIFDASPRAVLSLLGPQRPWPP